MATAARKTTIAPAPDESHTASPAFTLGKFTFTLRDEPAPLEAAKRSPNASPLPFKDWFPVLKEGQGLPIPDAWWFAPKSEGGRGMEPPKSKGEPVPMGEWAKRKLREAFATWRDTKDAFGKANDDEGGPAYDKELFPVYYAAGQGKAGGETVTEPHLVIWVKTVPGHTKKRKADMASSNAKRLQTLEWRRQEGITSGRKPA